MAEWLQCAWLRNEVIATFRNNPGRSIQTNRPARIRADRPARIRADRPARIRANQPSHVQARRLVRPARSAARLAAALAAALVSIITLVGCGPGPDRQYMQLFMREDRIYVLEASGSLYNLSADGKAGQPNTILPTGDTGGVVAGDRFYYVSGQRLMAYDLSRLTTRVLHEVGADEIPSLRLATEEWLVFGTARRQDGSFGAFSYHAVELATGQVTPLIGPPFTAGRTLTFLAQFEGRFYLTDQDALKLGVIGQSGGEVTDLSTQVADAPTHACISNGLLFLNALRKSLHVVSVAPESGEPIVRPLRLPAEIGAPGAMAPFGDGILLCMDDANLIASIYQLRDVNPQTGAGFRLSRVSDPEQFIADVWQMVASGTRFYCITDKGKGLAMGQIRSVDR